jgi:DNA-binding transcriptional MerR regulator
MRLAELSSRSGLPTATIKYYLRLGVLPAGETQSSTWASYGEEHVRRLALVRALTDVAGLSLEQVRRVLAAVDDEDVSLHESLGTAQWLLSPAPESPPSEESLARVTALLDRHGWHVSERGPLRARLAAQLDALAAVGLPATDEVLDAYVAALVPVVDLEVSRIPQDDTTLAVERMVVGTLLYEPVIATIRRMAGEVASAKRGR